MISVFNITWFPINIIILCARACVCVCVHALFVSLLHLSYRIKEPEFVFLEEHRLRRFMNNTEAFMEEEN